MGPIPIALGVAGLGAGIAAWGAFHPASQVFGPTVRRLRRNSTLAVTFDDGPNPAATPQLLDLLARHNARATFFVIGRYARQCPELCREIVARGHAIGNHTETHPSLTRLGPRGIKRELAACQEAIGEALGRAPLWMRPPFGHRSPFLHDAARRFAFRGVVMWTRSLLRDWEPQPAEQLIHRLRTTQGGDIVVLHDGSHRAQNAERGHVIAALEHWLPRWRDAGLDLVSLDDDAEAE